ncbi:hypothetical protein CBR_g22839 [Chara braunii]|uniref:Secreted protein n=1 Tax=Chara braunii TaxID=69332 RepID=A0A388L345_CHABU|nr:hypothetical protein CBR_g22839 [Chara braunii]|eukprot:GBG76623.1 hypothetical protein CBR_g22839 [Chara braunii]
MGVVVCIGANSLWNVLALFGDYCIRRICWLTCGARSKVQPSLEELAFPGRRGVGRLQGGEGDDLPITQPSGQRIGSACCLKGDGLRTLRLRRTKRGRRQ